MQMITSKLLLSVNFRNYDLKEKLQSWRLKVMYMKVLTSKKATWCKHWCYVQFIVRWNARNIYKKLSSIITASCPNNCVKGFILPFNIIKFNLTHFLDDTELKFIYFEHVKKEKRKEYTYKHEKNTKSEKEWEEV